MNTPFRLAAALALVLSTGAALADNGEAELNRMTAFAAPSGPSVSRAEVVADLHLWRQAGLGDSGEVDTMSPVYQAQLATYQRLRSGPAFAAEVERVLHPQNHATAALRQSRNTE